MRKQFEKLGIQPVTLKDKSEIEELNFDDRITNRIVKMALPVQFPDESIRTAIARKENDDLLDRLLGV
mgnify:CR=1 FL=1